MAPVAAERIIESISDADDDAAERETSVGSTRHTVPSQQPFFTVFTAAPQQLGGAR
jgi:hypothetical protein